MKLVFGKNIVFLRNQLEKNTYFFEKSTGKKTRLSDFDRFSR